MLDYLGIDKIDYGFISHLDLDHYGGFISLIYNDRLKEIYRPLPDSSEKSIRLEKFLRQKKIKTNIYDKSIIRYLVMLKFTYLISHMINIIPVYQVMIKVEY